MDNYIKITELLERESTALGLVFVGAVGLGPEATEYPRFERWLARGRHAGMRFLENHRALRNDPRALLEGARTAIVIGLDYHLGDRTPRRGDAPRIAQYARWRDYHKVLRQRGEALLGALHAAAGGGHVGRVVVDSAPLLERALAARTGRGFIGKNTCFIQPDRGSFVLLAELVTSVVVSDPPAGSPAALGPVDPTRRTERGGCGTCRRCQVHCPTGALDEDYGLDANKCLAYWTIEHRGTIPERFWPWLGVYYFGCDICQLVCPYNRKAVTQPGGELLRLVETPSLFEVATMSAGDYERLFGGTPMTRAKREGLMRNALIAMTVTSDARLDEALARIGTADVADVVRETVAQIERWRALNA